VIYVFPITIPANTPETSKLKTPLTLTRGKVTRVMVEFPAGHVGLTHLAINRGLFQLWPVNPETAFKSSNETIIWEEDYNLNTPPFQLEAYAWNEDDTYDHTITVRIVVEPLTIVQDLAGQIAHLLSGQEAAPGG
jgi:hypothetical protein